jgi:hypothetical protein
MVGWRRPTYLKESLSISITVLDPGILCVLR